MINQVENYVMQGNMVSQGDKVLAAVSGGADSVALLLILKELQKKIDFSLKVIHVEHGIRGEESQADARFVESLCQKLDIECIVRHVDVPQYAEKSGLGEEEAARALRYEQFFKVAKEDQGASEASVKIAIAHHLEDNAETILFQMARGTGIDGLCGMVSVRKIQDSLYIIRPLLNVSRGQIEKYLQDNNQKFCTDATNFDTKYSRNRIRKKILPELQEINSEAIFHINQTAEKMSEIRDFFSDQVDVAYRDCVEEKPIILNIQKLEKYHYAIQKSVIRKAIINTAGKKKDITTVHAEDVLELTRKQSGKQIMLPYGIVAKRSYDTIKFFSDKTMKYDKEIVDYNGIGNHNRVSLELLESLKDKKPGEKVVIPLEEFGGFLELSVIKNANNSQIVQKKKYTKYLDYDKIKKGFEVRGRRSGDFFISDAKMHRKKLKSYFIDEKVESSKRDHIPLLAQGSEIIWIIGMRINFSYKISEKTKYILEIHYNGGEQNGYNKA